MKQRRGCECLPVEHTWSKCQGCFADASQIHLRLTLNHLSLDHHQKCYEKSHSVLQGLHVRHTSEISWRLKSQMSDATNVFLNHDKIQFSILCKSHDHPLVWQMCMLSVHSLIPRPSACVRSGAFSCINFTDIVSRCCR